MKHVKIYMKSGNIIDLGFCGGVKIELDYDYPVGNHISSLVVLGPLPKLSVPTIVLNQIEAITERDIPGTEWIDEKYKDT